LIPKVTYVTFTFLPLRLKECCNKFSVYKLLAANFIFSIVASERFQPLPREGLPGSFNILY